MTQKLILIIFLFFLAILQVSFLPVFFSNFLPEIVLTAVVLWTVKDNFSSAWKMAFLAGVFLDLFSFATLGVNIFSLVATVFLMGFIARIFLVSSGMWKFFSLGLIIVSATILNMFFLNLIEFFQESLTGSNQIFNFGWNEIFKKSLYNLVVALIIYSPLVKLKKWASFSGNKIEVKNDVQ